MNTNNKACNKCISKICKDCEEITKIGFSSPYQEGINQIYYNSFFRGENIPWFSNGVNIKVKRETEGKHPNIIKNIVGLDKVLDAGCGMGFLVGFLRELGVKAYGFDYSEYAINNCFDLAKEFIQLSRIEKIPYKDNSFDFIICREVFEHLTVQECLLATKELLRVLKPGGFLYLTIWIDFSEKAHPDILCYDLRDDSHKTFMPREFWYRFFSNNFNELVYDKCLVSKLDWMKKNRVFVYRKVI